MGLHGLPKVPSLTRVLAVLLVTRFMVLGIQVWSSGVRVDCASVSSNGLDVGGLEAAPVEVGTVATSLPAVELSECMTPTTTVSWNLGMSRTGLAIAVPLQVC